MNAGDGDLATPYTNAWLAAAGRQIATSNLSDGLDIYLARHFVGNTAVPGLKPDTNWLSSKWLERNHDRLGQAPTMAAIGYGLADASPTAKSTARTVLVTRLQRLMNRSPFTDRLTFIYDPGQVVGIGLAAQATASDLPVFSEWLADILQDQRLQPSGRFQQLLYQHVHSLLTERQAAVDAGQDDDVSAIALRYWMSQAGTAPPPDPRAQHGLQQRILTGAIRTDPAQLPVSRLAVIYRVVTAILDASIDQAILSRSHLVTLLSRFEAAMRRWRFDDDSVKKPIRWAITAEREVQDILWLILSLNPPTDMSPVVLVGGGFEGVFCLPLTVLRLVRGPW